jgi:hypothetical protein
MLPECIGDRAMVVAVLGAAAASAAVKEVEALLTAGRSVVLEVDNNTDATFNVTHTHHTHGGFAVPPKTIPPRSALVFGSQSTGFLTGTEGAETFSGNGADVTVSWDNPWIGSNSSDARVTGSTALPSLPIVGETRETK